MWRHPRYSSTDNASSIVYRGHVLPKNPFNPFFSRSRNRLSKVLYIFHEFFSLPFFFSKKDREKSNFALETLLSFPTKISPSTSPSLIFFENRTSAGKRNLALPHPFLDDSSLIRGLQTLDMVRSTERSYTFAHGSRQISHVSGDGDLYPWLSRGRIGRGRNRPSATFFTLRVGYPSCRPPPPPSLCVYTRTCITDTHTRIHPSYEMALS